MFVVPRAAPAGDDVDYSAPYLVVEDGELVTKYPALEHTGGATADDTGIAADATTGDELSYQQQLLRAAAAVGVLAFLMWIRSRE